VWVLFGAAVGLCWWWYVDVCSGGRLVKMGVVWGCGHGVLYGRPSVRPEMGIQKPVHILLISALPKFEGWFERGWCNIRGWLGVSGGIGVWNHSGRSHATPGAGDQVRLGVVVGASIVILYSGFEYSVYVHFLF